MDGHVATRQFRVAKGAAAGALNLSRVIGAGLLTGIVLLMMSQYDVDTAPGWMMVSLVLVATVTIIATLWTVTSLRGSSATDMAGESTTDLSSATSSAFQSSGPMPAIDVTHSDEAQDSASLSGPVPDDAASAPHDSYFRFLMALTAVITGFSALQLYSFFYLEDVIGLENAARGAVVILLTTGLAAALTVLPAGRLADRIGRDPMLYVGGALGVLATIILIFAESMIVVALDGLIIGVVIGIFLTVSWALANDLVSKRNAARDLGYASVAVLIGSAASRIAGFGVDILNEVQAALGYQVVLGGVAICFVIAVALMTRLDGLQPVPAADAVRDGAVAD